MEKEENLNKKNKGKTIAIVVLVILVLGLAGYIVYDKNLLGLKKEKEISEEKKNVNKESKMKELDVTSEKVNSIMNALTDIYIGENNFFGSDSYNIDSITTEDLVGSAMKISKDKVKSVSACEEKSKRVSIKKDEFINTLNSGLKEYFLDKSISAEDLKNLPKSSYEGAKYAIVYGDLFEKGLGEEVGIIDEGTNIKLLTTCGNTFSAEPFVFGKIEKAMENDKKAYIYQKVVFAKYSDSNDWNEDHAENIIDGYKDYARKDKVSTFKYGEMDKIDYSSYNTYKYTFEKEDGKYYFEKAELEK